MRILVADDEPEMVMALEALLRREHYSVDVVYDGQDALDYGLGGNYDCIVLDIMMPKLDGLSVLRRLRENGNQVPVLMLTAKSEIEDKVLGLDSGANDYLAKPFSTRELLARIRAMTRNRTVQSDILLQMGNITLNCSSFELSTLHGRFRLPNKEYQMLEMLLRTPSSLISAERFLEVIWGYDSDVETNVVWVHISRLRKKLSELRADVEIAASRNAGYYLRSVK